MKRGLNLNEEHLIKIIAIIAFLLITLSLIIIERTPKANGYEISIYDSFPSFFWFSISLSILCGIIILIYCSFLGKRHTLWISGFAILLLINLIILLLPFFRGYYVSDFADEVTHIGLVKDIANLGNTGYTNVYPISHILVSEVVYLCGFDSMLVLKIMPSIFYFVYIISIYLLISAITKDVQKVAFVMVFCLILSFTYFNYLFLPTQLFLYFVPFILLLFYKKSSTNSLAYKLSFIITLLGMPFFHPLGSLFLVITFVLWYLSLRISEPVKNTSDSFISITKRSALNSALIILIIFIMWISYFAFFQATVQKAYTWFVYGYGSSPVEKMGGTIEQAGFTFFYILELFIRSYGHDVLLLILSIIATIVISIRIIKKDRTLTYFEIFFSIFALSFSLIFLSTLLGDFIITGGSIRILCWALMASSVLNGLFFYDIISRLKGVRLHLAILFIAMIIVLASINGLFTVYQSPYMKKANVQVTKMDWVGMEWIFIYKNRNEILHINQFPFRARQGVYGVISPRPPNITGFSDVEPHFNYTNLEKDLNAYVVVTGYDKSFYKNLWSGIGRFNYDDFDSLEENKAVNKIYLNGELYVWTIQMMNKSKI